jgi:poly(3-hydroxybutyrate) depolymerase
MSPVADRLGFAVVYPDAIDKHWRYGLSEIDDVDLECADIGRVTAG